MHIPESHSWNSDLVGYRGAQESKQDPDTVVLRFWGIHDLKECYNNLHLSSLTLSEVSIAEVVNGLWPP